MGIANALLDACEQEMAQPVVRLCVRRSNLDAQSLYLKRGYTQTEIWEKYYEGGEDALVLEKHQYNLKV
jgi:ribosomal protein S18 acetylase RimI-like enzyme